MHAIAHRDVRTQKEGLHRKLTLGRKSFAAPENQTCVSGVTVQCSNQVSYIPNPLCLFLKTHLHTHTKRIARERASLTAELQFTYSNTSINLVVCLYNDHNNNKQLTKREPLLYTPEVENRIQSREIKVKNTNKNPRQQWHSQTNPRKMHPAHNIYTRMHASTHTCLHKHTHTQTHSHMHTHTKSFTEKGGGSRDLASRGRI